MQGGVQGYRAGLGGARGMLQWAVEGMQGCVVGFLGDVGRVRDDYLG